jgi:hypothetical protein
MALGNDRSAAGGPPVLSELRERVTALANKLGVLRRHL